MKVMAQCQYCGKEVDISTIGIGLRPLLCTCRCCLVTATGKAVLRVIPENEEDERLLGRTCESDNTTK